MTIRPQKKEQLQWLRGQLSVGCKVEAKWLIDQQAAWLALGKRPEEKTQSV